FVSTSGSGVTMCTLCSEIFPPNRSLFFFLSPPPTPRSTLFPYTTLFRSEFRPGTQTQEYIKGMEDSSSEVTVNREVTTDNPYTIDRKSTRLNSSHVSISYAVFCLKKKKKIK